MRVFTILAAVLLTFGGLAAEAAVPRNKAHKNGKIVITVDLARRALWVEKITSRGHFNLGGSTLPIVRQSIHAGTFRPTKMYTHFRTVNGNTYLENVIFFDGAHAIRTTRRFAELQKGGRPVSGQVTLEPDFGMIVYQTVNAYGPEHTAINVR